MPTQRRSATQSREAAKAQAQALRMPVVHLTVAITRGIDAGGGAIDAAGCAVFPFRVDVRMTVESLLQAAFAQYANHCRDGGIPFDPPSSRADDYDLRVCTADGIVNPTDAVFAPQSISGATLKQQLTALGLASPVSLAMVPGALWAQRHALERTETLRREALRAHRDSLMQRAKALASMSQQRAALDAKLRARHMNMVNDLESVIFAAFAHRNNDLLRAQSCMLQLEGSRAAWDAAAERVARDAAALEATKRKFFAHCANAARVDTGAATMGEAGHDAALLSAPA